ncbi:MAG: monovalent cation/H+ antiporter complex subunit F [Puniceicoccaceae bacterium]
MFSEIPQLPEAVILICRIILGIALFLSGWRLFIGPSLGDRIVALELVAALMMSNFILQVLSSGFISYLDIALALAVISFLGTVAFARYMENRRQLP